VIVKHYVVAHPPESINSFGIFIKVANVSVGAFHASISAWANAVFSAQASAVFSYKVQSSLYDLSVDPFLLIEDDLLQVA
jgi:hypothetical protein